MNDSVERSLVSACRSLSRAAAIIAVVSGLLALAGWLFGIDFLKTIVASGYPMKANAAVCFILCGAALWLMGRELRGAARGIGQACAALAVLIGLATLAEYLFGTNLGIDQLLFREAPGPRIPHPGRMPPLAAADFVLVGCALLLLDAETRRGRRPAQLLALPAGLIALFGTFDYVLDMEARSSGMALHGALLFDLLSLGVLLARPEKGVTAVLVSPRAGGMVARRLLPSCVAALVVVAWLRWMGQRVGLYGTESGVILMVTSAVAVIAVLIWMNARALDQADEQRQRTEQALRKSEDRFRLLYEEAPLGYQSLDADGRFLEINQAWLDMLGYSREEVIGKWFGDFLSPESRELFRQRFPRFKERGHTQGTEFTMVRKDGSAVPVSIDGRTAGNLDGQFKQSHCILYDISGRKRAEEALRASETRYRNLADSIADVFFALDQDLRYIYWNKASEELTGISAEDAIGKSLQELFPDTPETRRAEMVYRDALRTKQPRNFVNEYQLEGRDYCFEISVYPSADGVSIFARDITERRQAEGRRQLVREVLDLLNRPESAADTIRDILHLVKKSTGIEAVGIRLREGDDFPYYETDGFSEDFVLGERFLCARDEAGKIVRDEQGNPVLECMCGNVLCGRTDATLPFFTEKGSFWTNNTTKLLASTTEKERQSRTRNRCNGAGYESVALIPLVSGGGMIGLLQLNDRRPDRFTEEAILLFESLGASVGIALSRKQSEKSIAHLNRVLRAIRNVNQLIVRQEDPQRLIQDTCDVLVRHGDYASALIILTDQEGTPRGCAQVGLGEAFQALAERLRQGTLPFCCEGARLHEGVFHVTDRAGVCAPCPIAAGCAPSEVMCIRLKHGQTAYGYLAVAADRALESDSEEESLFAEMSDDVAFALYSIEQGTARQEAEQARELAEEQFQRAQKMEAVGRLAGGVAHDFSNLLMVIQGYNDMLLKKLGPADTQRPALEEIRKAGEMATVLTRQLLAFSRKQVLRPQVLDLSTVVSNMEIMLRRLIGEDIELIVLPGAALDRVKADPGQIEQVVMNLVVNARDAMPSGGKLTIETADVDLDEEYARRHGGVQPGPYVWLSVSDTGCGMDAETQARIFEPFFTSKVRGKGTGLGLATVYGIIKQSGGWISVYSEVGQGTVFKIYLPRVPDSVEVPQQKEIQQKLPGGGETILVAEDDQSVRAVVCGALAETGYTVLEARDGPEALRVAKEYSGPIHLLITDVVMPQMSGRELVQCLLAQRPATRLLYMSGYTDDAFGNHGVLAGSASFLQKPFSADTLSRKVREVLDQPKQRAGRRPSHRR